MEHSNCDSCDEQATEKLDRTSSRYCAWWFSGDYCDLCFNKVSEEMKKIYIMDNLESAKLLFT